MGKATLDAGLTPKMQGQKFAALLAAKLIALGYTVAVPEPDSGEDLWIGTPADKKTNVAQRTIYRAQVKGLFTFAETEKEKKRSYESNDYVGTLDYAISRSGFVYFFGIRDDRLQSETGEQFHIGCIPAKGFLQFLRTTYPKAGVSQRRVFIRFIVRRHHLESSSQYDFHIYLRRVGHFAVTPFFDSVDLGLQIAEGAANCPDACLSPLPLKRVSARKGRNRRAK